MREGIKLHTSGPASIEVDGVGRVHLTTGKLKLLGGAAVAGRLTEPGEVTGGQWLTRAEHLARMPLRSLLKRRHQAAQLSQLLVRRAGLSRKQASDLLAAFSEGQR